MWWWWATCVHIMKIKTLEFSYAVSILFFFLCSLPFYTCAVSFRLSLPFRNSYWNSFGNPRWLAKTLGSDGLCHLRVETDDGIRCYYDAVLYWQRTYRIPFPWTQEESYKIQYLCPTSKPLSVVVSQKKPRGSLLVLLFVFPLSFHACAAGEGICQFWV